MLLTSWLDTFRKRSRRAPKQRWHRAARTAVVECLEDRTLLSTAPLDGEVQTLTDVFWYDTSIELNESGEDVPSGTALTVTMDGTPHESALVRFDIGAIPTGSTIQSVSLTFHVTDPSTDTYEMYDLKRLWTEGSTYEQVDDNFEWEFEGAQGAADRGSTVLGTLTAPTTGFATVELNADGIAVVQSWVDGLSFNWGFIFQDYTDATDRLAFRSTEDPNIALRPRFTITYVAGTTDPLNHPPFVNAGANQLATVGEPVSLDGLVSDDGVQEPVVTNWSLLSGPVGVTFADATAVDTTAVFAKAGTYVLQLAAFDGQLSASDTVTIFVDAPPLNQPPVVEAGADQSVFVTDEAALNGTVFDDGLEGPLSTTWNVISGPGQVEFADATSVDTTATFSTTGTYVLRLTADDGGWVVASDVTVSVYAQPTNQAPVVSVGADQSIGLADALELAGTIVDDSALNPTSTLTVLWSQVSGPGAVNFSDASDPQSIASFSEAGTYVLRLTADDGELTGSDELTVVVDAAVTNTPPRVDAGRNQTIPAGAVAQLAGLVADDGLPLGAILATTWSVVSGPGTVTFANPSSTSTTASFSQAGTYVLRLTAYDGQLAIADEVTITIDAGNGGETTVISFQDGLGGYNGTLDTRLDAQQPTRNYGSDDELRLIGNPDNAALIRWDVSSIAPGSVVTAASITLDISNDSEDLFYIYAMLRPWIESQATWQRSAVGQLWGSPGATGAADRGTAVLGTLVADDEDLITVVLNQAGVELVQQWINDPLSNHGVIFQNYNNAANDRVVFESSEADSVSSRPKLTLSVAADNTSDDDGGAELDLLPVGDVSMSRNPSQIALPVENATGDVTYYVSLTLGGSGQLLPAGSVTASVSGGTLTLSPGAGFTGQFDVTVAAFDDTGSDTETFSVTVGNTAPMLAGISRQTPTQAGQAYGMPVYGYDPDGDPLTYTAEIVSDDPRYQLDATYGFHADDALVQNNYYWNLRGLGEKYLAGEDAWYAVFSSGDLYRWGGSLEQSTLVATLDGEVFDDPSLLWNAVEAYGVWVDMAGDLLAFQTPPRFAGMFHVRVTASDGLESASQVFTIDMRSLADNGYYSQDLDNSQAAALAQLVAEIPDLMFHTDLHFGVPSMLMNLAGTLTGPSASDPIQVALDFLNDHRDLFGLTVTDLGDILVTSQHTSSVSNVTHVYMQQTYEGLAVDNAVINASVDSQGRLLVFGNSFAPDVASSLNTQQSVLTAEEAVDRAARALGVQITEPLTVLASAPGPSQSVVFTDGGISHDPIPVQLRILPIARGESRLVWTLVIAMRTTSDWLEINVDAETGDVFAQMTNWTDDASYRVFPLPLENPDDGGGLPGNHVIIVDPSDPAASPFGWHDTDGVSGAEFTDTRGNNVFAQDDRDANNTGGSRPDGGATNDFDFAFDATMEPEDNLSQAVVNLFYWNNIIHDVMAHYGFDEASGNFQAFNYSGFGLGGDAVQADAQDGADFGVANNANFGTPPDGTPPRMQMFEFTLTSPKRDSDNEATIIVHEYGHGISNRLVGGAADADALEGIQSGGMGEGWSDWYGLVFTAKPSDTSADAYPVGTYVLGEPLDGAGIRRFPYSTDQGVNPLTYGDIMLSAEVHDVGEIWASALWDLYWILVDRDGFDADLYTGSGGNNLALELVTEGMKFMPSSPTMLEARDGILAADLAITGGLNQIEIWTAFAGRGMGYSAFDGGGHNSTAVVEAFDLPATSRGIVEFDAQYYETGDTVIITVRDLDLVGAGTIDVEVVSSGGDVETITLTELGAGVFEGTVSTAPEPFTAQNGILEVDTGDEIIVTYNDDDTGGFGVGLSFTGSVFAIDSGFIPPDTMAAVGLDHIVEMINGSFKIYDKDTGTVVAASTLDEFWIAAGAEPEDFSFDPRVLFDHDSQRWFAAAVDNAGGANSFLVAVSASSDPTLGWNAFSIDSDTDNVQWADFPTMGLDADGLYISANMFPIAAGSFAINILSIPKADLLAATPTVENLTLLEDVDSAIGFSVQPAVDFGPSDGRAALLSAAADAIIRADILAGGTSSASVTTPLDIPAPLTNIDPPNADQPGPKDDVNTGDIRFSGNVMEVGDSLWAVHTVTDVATGNAAVRWYEIDETTSTVLQFGTIADADLDFYYPSIAANAFGDVVIGFSGSSATQFVSTYAAVGHTVAGTTTFAAPLLLKSGSADYELLDSIGRNRWGDYSATVVDPEDPFTFWTIQEFVTAEDTWAIEITSLFIGPAGPAVVTDTASIIEFVDVAVFDFSDDDGNPFDEGFTIDNTGGEVDGLWHLSTGRGNDPGHTSDDSFYYGTGEGAAGGGNYDVGHSAGRITSPEIDLTTANVAELSFNFFLETEVDPNFDVARLRVSADGGTFQTIASNSTGSLEDPTGEWRTFTFDLTPFAGSVIRVQFDFDSVDDILNEFEGWYVDDVIVRQDNTSVTAVTVGLSVDPDSFAEDGGTAIITATLSEPLDEDLVIDLGFSGTAVNNVDYIATAINPPGGPGAAPITIDGNFDDWRNNPNIQFYTDAFNDQHDTDTTGEDNVPLFVDHPDVDLLEFAVTHDAENLYFYFRATGEIGRTQAADPDLGLVAGRYYIIVTIDVDQNDVTGYPLHEGGYYPTTPGYDVNAEVEYFNGEFNTGNYLNHGAVNQAELDQAFLDQSQGQFVPGGEIQGPYDPGFVRVVPGSYDFYTQWVYKDNDPDNGGNDSVTFVYDRGPIVLGIITGALSADGHEYEMIAPLKGFLVDENGNPIIGLGSVLDLSFSLEASPELAPGGQWGSDTADPIEGYVLFDPANPPVTSIVIPAGSTQASIRLTGVDDAIYEGDEPLDVTITNVSDSSVVVISQERTVTATILDDESPPSVTLSLTEDSFVEPGGETTVVATLSAVSGLDVTVELDFGGGAVFGGDYSASETSILIPAGEFSGSITLTGIDDALFEGNETVVVDIGTVTNGTEDGDQTVTATIIDDEDPPEVILSLTGSPFPEDGGTATVTATLSAVSALDVTIELGFAGTATFDIDYLASDTTIFIAAGDTQGSITLTGLDDSLIEAINETIEVDIISVENGVEFNMQQRVTAVIVDDEPRPNVTFDVDPTIIPETGGSAIATATIDAVAEIDVIVSLLFGGSAVKLDDYIPSAEQIVIPAHSLSASITIDAIDDPFDEPPETVSVSVSNITDGVPVGPQQDTITIIDDDPPPDVYLTVGNSQFDEDNGVTSVTATLSVASQFNITVQLGFGGQAVFGTDYSASATSIFIPAGNTSGSITLTGIDDSLFELGETVEVEITETTNAVEAEGDQRVFALILDDDPPPEVSLSLTEIIVPEDGGETTLVATLSKAVAVDVFVDVAVSGTADPGDDYELPGTPVPFDVISILIPAGLTTGSQLLTALDDVAPEPVETVRFDIVNVRNGVEARGFQQVTALIFDDDTAGPGTLAVTDASILEGNILPTLTFPSSQTSNYGTGSRPSGLGWGDLDGDGDIDLVVTNEFGELSGNSVSILLNNGDGTFSEDVLWSVSPAPTSVVVVDLDRDGDLDLAVTVGSGVAVMLNNGDATFTLPSVWSAGPDPRSIVAADFNDDGLVDLAVANASFGANSVSILFNTGDGTPFGGPGATFYGSPTRIFVGLQPRSLAVDDMDNDGDWDLITANGGFSANSVSVLHNNGSGSFQVSEHPAGHEPKSVTTGDVNGDGLPDIIVVNDGFLEDEPGQYESVSVLLNVPGVYDPGFMRVLPGSYDFYTQWVYKENDPANGGNDSVTFVLDRGPVVRGIVTGERSADGHELEMIAPFKGFLKDEFGNPIIGIGSVLDLSFSLEASPELAPGGQWGSDTADPINGYVVADPSTLPPTPIAIDGDFSDWHGNPNITFYTDPFNDQHDTDTTGQNNQPVHVNHPDVDLLEFAVTHDEENLYFYFRATGEIGRTQIEDLAAGLAAGRYYVIVTIDVDQDDSTGYYLDEGGYYPTTPGYDVNAEIEYFNGEFNTGHYINHGAQNDAQLLQAFLEQSQGQYVPGSERSLGAYSLPIPYSAIPNPGAVAMADLNVDGWSDLSVSADGPNDHSVSVMLYDGVGGFASPSHFSLGNGPIPQMVKAVDLDGDGDMDLVTANHYGTGGVNGVSALLNAADPQIAVFYVTLSSPSDTTVAVDYFTSDGSAVAGTDYVAASGTLIFAPGQLVQKVAVPIIGDTVPEPNVDFFLNLANPVNVGISDDSGTASVIDDDPPPQVSLSLDGGPLTEDGGGATITATLDAPSVDGVTIDLGFSGSASFLNDYVASDMRIFIEAGSTTGSITLTGLDDPFYELDESIVVTIVNLINAEAAPGADSVTTFITDNDDAPDVRMYLFGSPFSEAQGVARVLFQLSGLAEVPVTVDLAFSGTAIKDGDYFASQDPVVISALQPSREITLTGVPDEEDEDDETIIIDIESVANGNEADGFQQVTAIITESPTVGTGQIHGIKYFDQNANGVRDGGAVSPGDIVYAPIGDVILTRNDDLSTGLIPFEFTLDFFGQQFTDFYINNNGNITFTQPLFDFITEGFPHPDGIQIIAPFWADVDTRPDGSAEVHLARGISPRGNPFIQVDWPGVGYYNVNTDKLNFFTLYIEDDPQGDLVAFKYGDMQWTTGDVDGIGGFGGNGAQIGFDAGDGVNFFSYGRPSTAEDLEEFANQVLVFRLTGDGVVELEPGLAGVTVYLDLNDNLVRDAFEPTTVTMFDNPLTSDIDETGQFSFTGLLPGTYILREEVPFGFFQTAPGGDGSHTIDLEDGQVVTGLEIGNATLNPLLAPATAGEPSAQSASGAVTSLTSDIVQPLLEEAVNRLSAGVDDAVLVESLQNVEIQFADLGGTLLAVTNGNVITVDHDAAGFGWFIDVTPADDSEFALSEDGLYRSVSPAAAGSMDLLTVLLHELGHVLGLNDHSDLDEAGDLMYSVLEPGVRRILTNPELDSLFADPAGLSALLETSS